MTAWKTISVLAFPLQLMYLIAVPSGSWISEGNFSDGHDVSICSNVKNQNKRVSFSKSKNDD